MYPPPISLLLTLAACLSCKTPAPKVYSPPSYIILTPLVIGKMSPSQGKVSALPDITSDSPFSVLSPRIFTSFPLAIRCRGLLALSSLLPGTKLGSPSPYHCLLPSEGLPHVFQRRRNLPRENMLSFLPAALPDVPVAAPAFSLPCDKWKKAGPLCVPLVF